MLMGLANLVPGVSGGTMVLVMGLYDEFVTSIADVTKFRLSRRNVAFLGLLVLVAAVTIVTLSGWVVSLVSSQRSAMYSLFLGMTLGGAPLLIKMIKPFGKSPTIGVIIGLAVMIVIAWNKHEKPDTDAVKAAAAGGEIEVLYDSTSYGTDVAAGVLGMSSMVLPGISGAYMLLVLGRYVDIGLAIHHFKSYVVSGGSEGAVGALHVLVPVGIGAILSLVLVSNLLKWMLHHHPKPTLGVLLGILLGSVFGIWPFGDALWPLRRLAGRLIEGLPASAPGTAAVAGFTMFDYGLGLALALVGFAATAALSRLKD